MTEDSLTTIFCKIRPVVIKLASGFSRKSTYYDKWDFYSESMIKVWKAKSGATESFYITRARYAMIDLNRQEKMKKRNPNTLNEIINTLNNRNLSFVYIDSNNE